MKAKDYTVKVHVDATPEEAFEKIAKVDGWWAKNFSGKAEKLNDIFTVKFGKTFVDFKITAAVPGVKIIWHVTNCYLHWLEDKTEWNGTQVVWEINAENNGTEIRMTHAGLTPKMECYENCEEGWNGHIKKSLVNFIDKGKGQPE